MVAAMRSQTLRRPPPRLPTTARWRPTRLKMDFIDDYNWGETGVDIGYDTPSLYPADDLVPFDVSTDIFQRAAELQSAAELKKLAQSWQGSSTGVWLNSLADEISGVNMPGMEMFIDQMKTATRFFGIDQINVSYEPGKVGFWRAGQTHYAYDDFIGADPVAINAYTLRYGDNFRVLSPVHELGHHRVEQLLDIDTNTVQGRMAHEACADWMSGLYFGVHNLDPTGVAAFLADESGGLYPPNRDALFMEAYRIGNGPNLLHLSSLLDMPFNMRAGFNLVEELEQVAQRYTDQFTRR